MACSIPRGTLAEIAEAAKERNKLLVRQNDLLKVIARELVFHNGLSPEGRAHASSAIEADLTHFSEQRRKGVF